MNFHTIFDFSVQSNLQNWEVVDDAVMGGKSGGTFKINADGFGVFAGHISLENNGGFSLVRYRFEKIKVANYSKISIKLCGSKQRFQFRIKSNIEDDCSYISFFSTSGEWETIEFPLKNLYPWFRGKRLEQSNFSHDYMEEIGFLIGNKVAENFKLEIGKIVLQ
ncbi:MAG: CIA30 family protein [Flavobacteriales bacterium]